MRKEFNLAEHAELHQRHPLRRLEFGCSLQFDTPNSAKGVRKSGGDPIVVQRRLELDGGRNGIKNSIKPAASLPTSLLTTTRA
jgi:hypothetical protein